MKWYKLLPAVVAVCVVTYSCSNGLEEGRSSSSTPAATTPATINVPPPQQPQQTSAGAVQLNPPHGQPGHRCDIKVGEPLTGAAPATISTQTQQQPMGTVVPPPAQGATAAGKNPAHGQPGHRCDIAVGAPLNSKPTQ